MSAFADWLNQNALRSYPLAEGTSGLDDRGIALPQSLLVDMTVLCPDPTAEVRLSQAWYSPGLAGISLVVGGDPAATATVSWATYKAGTAVPLVPYPDTVGIQGWVVFGASPRVVQSRVTHNFATGAQSRLDAAAVRAIRPPGVRSIDATSGTARAAGLVRILTDGQLRVYRDPDDASTIRVAISSIDAQRSFLGPCNDVAPVAAPIRSINGVCPDATGVLTIQFEAAT